LIIIGKYEHKCFIHPKQNLNILLFILWERRHENEKFDTNGDLHNLVYVDVEVYVPERLCLLPFNVPCRTGVNKALCTKRKEFLEFTILEESAGGGEIRFEAVTGSE
jgi:predicted glycosyltransferase involved in capsule biosynthesis